MKMDTKKVLSILLIAGIGCLAMGSILGLALEKQTLLDQKGIQINESSMNYFQDCYAFPFSLKMNQRLFIKFSCYYVNTTAYIKIFGKGTYEYQVILNASGNPQTQNGKYYCYTRPLWTSFTGYYDRVLSVSDYAYNIEFYGDGSTSNIWSMPGDYTIVIYGINSWSGSEVVLFDLNLKISGPGDILNQIFSTAGWVILCVVGCIAGYIFYKKGGIGD